jgi:hypothetical protein
MTHRKHYGALVPTAEMAQIDVLYPFVRCLKDVPNDEGLESVQCWRPGVVYRAAGYYGDESEGFAHGVGSMLLEVVSTHKPGRFPERVFYTRKWRDPDGREFGNGALKITTAQAFKRMCAGFRYEYRIDEPAEGEVQL